jgi:hypothetical protein
VLFDEAPPRSVPAPSPHDLLASFDGFCEIRVLRLDEQATVVPIVEVEPSEVDAVKRTSLLGHAEGATSRLIWRRTDQAFILSSAPKKIGLLGGPRTTPPIRLAERSLDGIHAPSFRLDAGEPILERSPITIARNPGSRTSSSMRAATVQGRC